MLILLTGSTGYIGTHLKNKLIKVGHQLICTYRNPLSITEDPNIEWLHYDSKLSSLTIVNRNIDIIIHLATFFSSKNDSALIDNMIFSNILFGTHLLELAKIKGIENIITTSSYTQSIDNLNYNPQNIYSATKQAFDDILKFYTESLIVKNITLSLSDVYGPNDPRPKFINLVLQSSEGHSFKMSRGEQKIRYVFIDDVVEAYLVAINMLQNNLVKRSKTFSVFGKKSYSLKKLVEKICDVTKRNIKTDLGFYPYRNREIMNCQPRFKTLPNWTPKINLEQGIKKILYLKNK